VDLDVGIFSTNSSTLEVAYPRREFEQSFEIVHFIESAQMGMKRGANESQCSGLPPAPIFAVIGAALRKLCQVKCFMHAAPGMEK
jgi:hypothetical protein